MFNGTTLNVLHIVCRYEMLLEQGQMSTLRNAAGINSLPKYDWQHKLLATFQPKPKAPPGLFESIVKGYCDKKKIREDLQSRMVNRKDILMQVGEKNVRLLERLTNSVAQKVDDMKQLESGQSLPVVDKVNDSDLRIAFEYTDRNIMSHAGTADITDILDLQQPKTLLDSPVARREHEVNHRGLRQRRVGHSTTLGKTAVELQMTGTSKVSSRSDVEVIERSNQNEAADSLADNDGADLLQDKTGTFIQPQGQQKKVLESVRYDHRGGESSQPEEAYVYDARLGYQYPYGRHGSDPQRIKVSREHRDSNVVFRKGNTYYDEDGEFLYKVP